MDEVNGFLSEPSNMLTVWGVILLLSLAAAKLLAISFQYGWHRTLALLPLLSIAIMALGFLISVGLHTLIYGKKVIELFASDLPTFLAIHLETGIEYSALPAVPAILAFLWHRWPKKNTAEYSSGTLSLFKAWGFVFLIGWIIGFGLHTYVEVQDVHSDFQRSSMVVRLENSKQLEQPVFNGSEPIALKKYMEKKAKYRAKFGHLSIAAHENPHNFLNDYLRLRPNFVSQTDLTDIQFIEFIKQQTGTQIISKKQSLRQDLWETWLKGIVLAASAPILAVLLCLLFKNSLSKIALQRANRLHFEVGCIVVGAVFWGVFVCLRTFHQFEFLGYNFFRWDAGMIWVNWFTPIVIIGLVWAFVKKLNMASYN